MDTVKITGKIYLPDGSIPQNAVIQFTLTGFSDDSGDAVIPHSVIGDVASTGDIDIDVWPNNGPYSFLRYRITVIEYTDSTKQVEHHRHDLGSAKVVVSADIGEIIPLSVYKGTNQPLTYRKGDTISLGMVRTNLHGDRLTLVDVVVNVAMKHRKSGVITQFTTQIDDAPNGVFSAKVDTSALAVGDYVWNASFEKGGEKTSTDFGRIQIVEAVA